MEKLEGLDEELRQEEAERESGIRTPEDAKRKRRPFHYWTVDGEDHKMKLTTGMIAKLENKYRTNIMTLITANDIPPLSVMLTVAQAAISPWEHKVTYEKVEKLYDKWMEEGGNQSDFLTKVIIPTMAVSGFFTDAQTESILKEIEQMETFA